MININKKEISSCAENDFLKEVKETSLLLEQLSGGCNVPFHVSCKLGNNGKYCTLTKECMPSCNS